MHLFGSAFPKKERNLRSFFCVCVRRTQHHFATKSQTLFQAKPEQHSAFSGHKMKLCYRANDVMLYINDVAYRQTMLHCVQMYGAICYEVISDEGR